MSALAMKNLDTAEKTKAIESDEDVAKEAITFAKRVMEVSRSEVLYHTLPMSAAQPEATQSFLKNQNRSNGIPLETIRRTETLPLENLEEGTPALIPPANQPPAEVLDPARLNAPSPNNLAENYNALWRNSRRTKNTITIMMVLLAILWISFLIIPKEV